MPGVRGRITRAHRGAQRAVYLSDRFGVWQDGKNLHFTFLNKKQKLHTSITPRDGLLYDALLMLYRYGLRMEE